MEFCIKTGGHCEFMYGLKDFSVLRERFSSQMNSAFNLMYTVRTSLGIRFDEVHGEAGEKNEQIYKLNALDFSRSLCCQLKSETKTLKPSQRSFLLQPAVIYTDMLGRRLVRVFTAEMSITSNIEDLFVYSDIDCIANYLLKKCTFKKIYHSNYMQTNFTA